MSSDTPRVLSIQSHVVHGYVGNKSATFPMQILGFEVDAINTVQFATHGGYSHRLKGNVLPKEVMEELVQGLQLNEVDYYTHLITGYSRSADSLKQIAGIIKKLRQRNPDLIYVCDPVMGDSGKIYVPEEILPVYRDILVPLADILTPNQFEAELLTGIPVKDIDGALEAIRALHDKGVKTVVISSLDVGDDENMMSIASFKDSCYSIQIPKLDATFIGTGDLFAALYMSWSYKTDNNLKVTLEKTIATLQSIVKDTYQRARVLKPSGAIPPQMKELRIIQNKTAIENPVIEINATQIKAKAI